MTGDFTFLHVTPRDRAHMAVLETAYGEIYLPLFPPTGGYDSLEKWIDLMDNPGKQVAPCLIVAEDAPGRPAGICAGMHFTDSDTGYLAYIAVREDRRRQGLGRALFHEAGKTLAEMAKQAGGTLGGYYLDCEDPDKDGYNRGDTDPRKRLDMYLSWGGQIVVPDGNFRLLSVKYPGRINEYLTLVSFDRPGDGEQPGTETTLAFLRSLYRYLVPSCTPETNPGYLHVAKVLRSGGQQE